MIVASIETFERGLEELKRFLDGHYEELSGHAKHGIPLDPQYQIYIAREKAGELIYMTLRENGAMIGYFVGFLAPGLHYQSCLTLTMDVLYVVPEHRGKGAGIILGHAIKNEAKRRGAQVWFMGFKEEHRTHMEALLLMLGFAPFERTYALWMDH